MIYWFREKRKTYIFGLWRSPLPRYTEERHAAFSLLLQYSGFRSLFTDAKQTISFPTDTPLIHRVPFLGSVFSLHISPKDSYRSINNRSSAFYEITMQKSTYFTWRGCTVTGIVSLILPVEFQNPSISNWSSIHCQVTIQQCVADVSTLWLPFRLHTPGSYFFFFHSKCNATAPLPDWIFTDVTCPSVVRSRATSRYIAC